MLNSPRQHWLILCSTIGLITIIFLSGSLSVFPDNLLMPLDDSYIHFQYARQMALGEAFHYNPDNSYEATSGATSWLYTPLLAVGYLVGFHGLSLGIWAVGLGILAHVGNSWLIYSLLGYQRSPDLTILLLTLCYAVSGAFVWSALSGMEASLFIFSVLLTLYVYQNQRWQAALLAAGMAALLRPEGAIISLTTAAAIFSQTRQQRTFSGFWFLIPVVAILVQPASNYLMTGSTAATGNLSKSHLYNFSIPLTDRLITIGENWLQIVVELITGYSGVDGWYLAPLLTLTATFAGFLSLLTSWREKRLSTGLLILLWMLFLSLAIATLDTAFWHFKRYQLPLMALQFPLAGWLILRYQDHYQDQAVYVLVGAMLVFSLGTAGIYGLRYQDNVWVVKHQQLAMADWVSANIPPDERLAVHDVGMMGYLSEHPTYDVVGLTHPNPNVAGAWRQGSGTLYEVLASDPNRPDYFAIYPNVLGVPFLVEAGILGEELARFEIPLPPYTAASATGLQVVTQADWSGYEPAQNPQNPYFLSHIEGFTLAARLNIADLGSEGGYFYEWEQDETPEGFISQVRRLPYADCDTCVITDGGRVITGGEKFTLPMLSPNYDYVLIGRFQAASSATLTAGCVGETKQIRVIPALPAHWVEVPFIISPDTTEFCLESDGTYYPAYYWLYRGNFPEIIPLPKVIAQFSDGSDGSFDLIAADLEQTSDEIHLNLTFFNNGGLQTDGKIFLHLYDDLAAPPVAQTDAYLGGGLPPANWLQGEIQTELTLSLADLPEGEYSLGLGFYNPVDNTRYAVESGDYQVNDSRLLIHTIVQN